MMDARNYLDNVMASAQIITTGNMLKLVTDISSVLML